MTTGSPGSTDVIAEGSRLWFLIARTATES